MEKNIREMMMGNMKNRVDYIFRYLMKQIILMLSACLLLISCDGKVDTLYFNEKEQVFEISKAGELRYLNEVVGDILNFDKTIKLSNSKSIPIKGARFRLVNDIEITGKWSPIKYLLDNTFEEFDGNGHTITFKDVVYTINEKDLDSGYTSLEFGLFEALGNVTVKNLTLAGNITVQNNAESSSFSLMIGALAGHFFGGTIDNCTSNVNIQVLGGSNVSLGGLIGFNGYNSDGSGTNFYHSILNKGDITVKDNRGLVTVGGLAGGICLGETTQDTKLENRGKVVVNLSTKVGGYSGSTIGGVVGTLSSIKDACHFYNYADIAVGNHGVSTLVAVGGVAGQMRCKDKEWITVYDMRNSGKINLSGELQDAVIGGVAATVGGCFLHRLVNEGTLTFTDKIDCIVGGIVGSSSGGGFYRLVIPGMLDSNVPCENCIYSCCMDKVSGFPLLGKKDDIGNCYCSKDI